MTFFAVVGAGPEYCPYPALSHRNMMRGFRPPQTGKSALVIMFIQLGRLDTMAVGLQNPANVNGLTEKFASHMNCVVTRSSRAGLGQSAGLGKHNVPHGHGSISC